MGQNISLETYELFEMLGAKVRRVGVNAIGFNNEMAMQLVELTK